MRRRSSSRSNANRRRTVSKRKSRKCRRIAVSEQARRLADLRVRRRDEARQVDGHRRLERRVLVEVRHDERRVGVALDLEDDAHVVGRLVAHVDEGGEPPLDDDVGDLRDERGLLLRVRDRRDDDRLRAARALLDLPLAAQLQRALAALVDRAQLALGREEEAARREVRALDEAQRVRRRGRRRRRSRRRGPRPGCAAGSTSPCRPRCPSRR